MVTSHSDDVVCTANINPGGGITREDVTPGMLGGGLPRCRLENVTIREIDEAVHGAGVTKVTVCDNELSVPVSRDDSDDPSGKIGKVFCHVDVLHVLHEVDKVGKSYVNFGCRFHSLNILCSCVTLHNFEED